MLLCGSRAAAYWSSEMRSPNGDWDIICSADELEKYGSSHIIDGVRYEFSNHGDSYDILNEFAVETIDIPHFDNVKIIPFECLALIKRAHLHRPIKWFKHVMDYISMVHILDVIGIEYSTFYTTRLKEMETISNITLNKSNDEFFNNSQKVVNRIYVHDDIHRAVAFYDRPLYDMIKRDRNKAMVDYDLFNRLSFEDKYNLVREEAFVIALERFIIPNNVDSIYAFHNAMRMICTTLTKGWFRDFAIDYYEFITDCNIDYVAKFEEAKINGLIRRI